MFWVQEMAQQILVKFVIPPRHLAGVYAHAFLGSESPGVETPWLVFFFFLTFFQLTPENHGDYDALTTVSRVVIRISRKGHMMKHDCLLSSVP